MIEQALRKSERVILALRALYEQYGYQRFLMSKFEAYDFYNGNKDFLSDSPIITFSDMDGKLLALKPDITLSIVKNARASAQRPERVYYNESVYRVSREVNAFQENGQIGLEFIGHVTPYTNSEIITLALKSLRTIGRDTVLDISHMGFVKGLMESVPASDMKKEALFACIGQKSAHGLRAILDSMDVPEAVANGLMTLARLSGDMGEVLEQARPLAVNGTMQAAYRELKQLNDVFSREDLGGALRLDFSITSDVRYYNGLLLRGYVSGVARAVLSGGRYDPLLARMGQPSLQAIGFAINCDLVERALRESGVRPYDAAVIYDEASDAYLLRQTVEGLIEKGLRVYTGSELPAQKVFRVLRVVGLEVREEGAC